MRAFLFTILILLSITSYANIDTAITRKCTNPTVSAGVNQTVTLPNNSIVLVGSAIPNNGSPLTILWTKVSGMGVISNNSIINPTITGLTVGVSVYKLTATDGCGYTANSLVTINTVAASKYIISYKNTPTGVAKATVTIGWSDGSSITITNATASSVNLNTKQVAVTVNGKIKTYQ